MVSPSLKFQGKLRRWCNRCRCPPTSWDDPARDMRRRRQDGFVAVVAALLLVGGRGPCVRQPI